MEELSHWWFDAAIQHDKYFIWLGLSQLNDHHFNRQEY